MRTDNHTIIKWITLHLGLDVQKDSITIAIAADCLPLLIPFRAANTARPERNARANCAG